MQRWKMKRKHFLKVEGNSPSIDRENPTSLTLVMDGSDTCSAFWDEYYSIKECNMNQYLN